MPAVPVACRPEKNSVNRMIAPKSAIEAAAITSCPKLELTLPESFSTGTITPSEVEARTIAMNSGESTSPPAWNASPATTPIISRVRGNECRGILPWRG